MRLSLISIVKLWGPQFDMHSMKFARLHANAILQMRFFADLTLLLFIITFSNNKLRAWKCADLALKSPRNNILELEKAKFLWRKKKLSSLTLGWTIGKRGLKKLASFRPKNPKISTRKLLWYLIKYGNMWSDQIEWNVFRTKRAGNWKKIYSQILKSGDKMPKDRLPFILTSQLSSRIRVSIFSTHTLAN